ncbi:MAG: M42 family metallopeptidase [Rhodothermales bacterium]|nr:M42 family metallopeptidase [Rhodothermales bacterium]
MTAADKAFLFQLLDTPSPSGFESAGQRIWAGYLRRHADRVESDHYGNVWATLDGSAKDNAPRLMLEAHADEIGLMVNHISDDGFLFITRIGGSDRAIARGRSVRILGSQGEVEGILGNTAIHLRDRTDDKLPEWHDLFIDIGAGNKDAVAARGIRVGHPAVLAESARPFGDTRIVGRALDNRIGGFIIARVMAQLAASGNRPAATVHAVNAVQEEVGGHGARMMSYRLNPTVAVVLDVCHATDSPGISAPKHGLTKLGGGPGLMHGASTHPLVVQRLMEVAEKEGIPLQHEASTGFSGTDTDQIFDTRAGIPSALVSLPMRYMHSTVEMVDTADLDAVVRLLTAFVHALTPADAFKISI